MEPTRPKVKRVKAKENYRLLLTFVNDEERIFDATPYLKNFFLELKDPSYFNKVFVNEGSIGWPHGQDLAYDMLYFKSEPLSVPS